MIWVKETVLALVFMTPIAPQPSRATAAALVIDQVGQTVTSKEGELKSALFEIRGAIDRYYTANKRYPRTLRTLEAEGYLAHVPNDPFTNRNDSWRLIMALRTASDQHARPGIFDVRSSSKHSAMNGTKYSDW